MRILSALTLLIVPAALSAQAPAQAPASAPPTEALVDRVVAVVGDTALLLSDVRTAVQQLEASYQAAGRPLPSDAADRDALSRQVFEEKINELLLIEAARDAGTLVDEQAIRDQVDQEVRRIVESFQGSEVRFAQALAEDGLTMSQYRTILEQQFRDQQLRDNFLAERLRSRSRPVVSEDQLREAFQQYQGQLGTRPASISLRQVIVKPVPSDSALAKALATTQDVVKQLQEGGDFAVLARRFSDDPGSKDRGGSIGWFKQGRGLVPEFEEMAFAIRPGMTSPIIKSEFGFHIIEVLRVRGPEREIRHILIRPEITPADEQRARERADSVATALRNGANPAALARAYGTSSREAELTRIAVRDLPPAYATPLATAQAGEVVGPVEIPGSNGKSYAVIRVTERQPEGPFTLDDVRDQLTTRIQESQMLEQLVEDLRQSVYVHVMR